ncbi:MAG: flagellar biosynthetic protein FliO [Lamprobacter sp.]|uniref:FliO/MopB family protein n=1 Tax=Lamprobacter sp. TaxID=3100796 RepID=UPI002B25D9ED|nr:flagellar biosynthetic protein FliO [Lamprobacter sp.]MEA3639803.1 flagellar biosynthetic protein FliO [Lamprobacter sp.]
MNQAAASDTASVIAGGDTLIGLATLGKLTLVLMVIVIIILLGAVILRKVRLGDSHPAASVRVVGSAAVGPKERVVVVEVASAWLVLGVGGGQVTRLHKLPAPPPRDSGQALADRPVFNEGDSFAARFAKALKHNVGMR